MYKPQNPGGTRQFQTTNCAWWSSTNNNVLIIYLHLMMLLEFPHENSTRMYDDRSIGMSLCSQRPVSVTNNPNNSYDSWDLV